MYNYRNPKAILRHLFEEEFPDGDLYYSEDDEFYSCLSAKAVLVTED